MLSQQGLALSCFSFGADSPEKFTAERHFGVDKKGVVYKMDVPGGGEYKPIPGQSICSDAAEMLQWLGEYHDRNKTLVVSNYREGPLSHYFQFNFLLDGKEAGQAVVAADGWSGSYCGLSFTLDAGVSTLTVSRDAAMALCQDEEWLEQSIGVYHRR